MDKTLLASEGIVFSGGALSSPAGDAPMQENRILSVAALRFVAKLSRQFGARREQLLVLRLERQSQIDAGIFPIFPAQSLELRMSDWRVAEIPADLRDRRVEITGPVDRKMVINALNSGASTYMADFEDSHSPTWKGTIEGQNNLYDAVRGQLSFTSPEGKEYSVGPEPSVLMVRPRGWHLTEKHLLVDGNPVSASLFDFGLYFFHNAAELLKKGSGPYFYLPKLESHLEARLWNDVFCFAQDDLNIARGSIRATVLIETILAAFEMDEILYELKDHSAGLNCGRWDYIFSFIKKFRKHPAFVLPDRATVTMDVPFLNSYCELLIQTCHKRGIHAMGGMAAQIPIKNDPAGNEAAMTKVRADKEREVRLGHDGTWVAHPALVGVARSVFDSAMPHENQIPELHPEWQIDPPDLMKVPRGEITEQGLRKNINISLRYLESWLRGQGCVPLYNLMEDAATAEISRAQIWQWLQHQRIDRESYRKIFAEELGKIDMTKEMQLAAKIFEDITLRSDFVEFLTLPAYEFID